MIESQDWMKQFTLFDYNATLKCRCGWTGEVNKAIEKPIRTDAQSWQSLGGREGWHYHCPVCNWMLTANYTKVS